MDRVGLRVHIILSNDYSYTGTILEEDNFFIVLLDRYNKKVSLGKKDIQAIREV